MESSKRLAASLSTTGGISPIRRRRHLPIMSRTGWVPKPSRNPLPDRQLNRWDAGGMRAGARASFRTHLASDLERTAMTTSVSHIPEGLSAVTPYLIVRDSNAAIDFYK